MATQAYKDWLGKGRPYTLIRPAKQVQAKLRAYGLTVYDYPNDAHLQANVPEDHTPFSVTGWPSTNKKYNARALDIMPRSDSYDHRLENANIARQLIKDRDAGYPGAMWIKYLNWTDETGKCRQERWTDSANPNKRTTRESSDEGHIHISGRSDVDTDTRADDYDPYARMKGQTMTDTTERMAANAERGVTAWYTGQNPVQFPYPWGNPPGTGSAEKPLENPIVRLEKKVDDLGQAGVSDERLVAAVKQALLDPEVARIFGELMFNAAQRAEKE